MIPSDVVDDGQLMAIAEHQIDWIADKLEGSRSAGRLALLSVLMGVREDCCKAMPDLTALRAAFHEGWLACEHMGGTLSEEECWQDSQTRSGSTSQQPDLTALRAAPQNTLPSYASKANEPVGVAATGLPATNSVPSRVPNLTALRAAVAAYDAARYRRMLNPSEQAVFDAARALTPPTED